MKKNNVQTGGEQRDSLVVNLILFEVSFQAHKDVHSLTTGTGAMLHPLEGTEQCPSHEKL